MSFANLANRFNYHSQSRTDAMRSLSLLNFLHFAALGFASPFINIYLKEAGLSATTIGILISIGAILELTLNPLVNSQADKYRVHRLVIRMQWIFMVFALLIFATSAIPALLGVAFLMNAVNGRGANEMLAQLTLTRLEDFQSKSFGKVRVWGSFGWALASLLSSPVIAFGGYTLSFLSAAITRFTMLPTSQALPKSTNVDEQASDEDIPPMGRPIYILMVTQFFFFMGFNGLISFIWIHFREGLNVFPEHIGILAASYAIAEFGPMLYVDRIVSRIGAHRVVLIGIMGMTVEWFVYSLITNGAWIIPLAFARATFFTMAVVGMALLISEVSDSRRVATNRALIQVTMPALAILLTSPFMGWIYDNYGATTLFYVLTLIGATTSFFLFSQIHHLKPSKTKPHHTDDSA